MLSSSNVQCCTQQAGRWADKQCCLVQIHPELMPDALHPNAAGMELFAQCLSPLVDQLMTSSMTLQGRSTTWRG